MTDKEIIQGLIDKDNFVTEQFFFIKCRPLFRSIIRFVFSYEVDYDEFVNDLYLYLMTDDAIKLRRFQYRSSVYQWLKVIAIRYFIYKRDNMIENVSKETLYRENTAETIDEPDSCITDRIDLQHLFCQIENKRYVYVIKKLVLEEMSPDVLAQSMRITTANLYNIKKRAMAALTRVAFKDINCYENKKY